jgi:hypothetical protein
MFKTTIEINDSGHGQESITISVIRRDERHAAKVSYVTHVPMGRNAAIATMTPEQARKVAEAFATAADEASG